MMSRLNGSNTRLALPSHTLAASQPSSGTSNCRCAARVLGPILPDATARTSPAAPRSTNRPGPDRIRPARPPRTGCRSGVNRHVGSRIGDTYVRYNSITKIAARAGNRRKAASAPSSLRLRQDHAPRVNPERSSCSSRAEIACRLPGSARITTRSPGSNSSSRPGDMAQPPRHPVPLHRRSHRLPHHQTDSRAGACRLVTLRMHDEVAVDGPHPLLDRGAELGRPRHPVPRRKHRR